MTKLKNPLLSLGARNTIGKILTFVKRRRMTIAETKPEPPDAKTLAQLSWRHMYQKAVALWHALAATEKQDWESQARSRHMTGFAWFMSQALKPNPGLYLPLQGGSMSGDIEMNKNRILELPAPTDSQEAARKAEVDAITGEHSFAYWRRLERWHFSASQAAAQVLVLSANTFYAVPFYSPVPYTVTKIGVLVTSGAAGLAHLGVYNDDGSIYPGTLLSDCGVINVTVAGSKEIMGLSLSFLANTLYWLVFLSNVGPTMDCIREYVTWAFIGSPNTNSVQVAGHYYKAHGYAVLPANYPAGANSAPKAKPGIGVYLT